MSKETSGKCTICTNFFSVLHWHHTVPRSLGGEDSLQIPLCADCHNVLHAHALAIVARTLNGTKIKKDYWHRPGDLERAEPYLNILVESILFPPNEQTGDKEYTMQAKVNEKMHLGLRMLKKDIGAANLQQAILYCIAYTLQQRGLYNDGKEQHRAEGNSQHKNSTTDLW